MVTTKGDRRRKRLREEESRILGHTKEAPPSGSPSELKAKAAPTRMGEAEDDVLYRGLCKHGSNFPAIQADPEFAALAPFHESILINRYCSWRKGCANGLVHRVDIPER
jgi:hypothetical protein